MSLPRSELSQHSQTPITWQEHRKVFLIALPMMVSNIAAPLLGLVDTAIIGHLPEAIYLSAVATGAMVISFLYLLAIFLRMSTTGLMAQAFGAKNLVNQRTVLLQAASLAVILGVLMILLQPAVIWSMQTLVAMDGEFKTLATAYVQIRIFGAPAALLNLVVLGVLLGRQQAGKAMFLVIFTNVVNVIGTVVLVLVLNYHVYGAAVSTLIAEWATCALGLYWLQSIFKLRWPMFKRLRPQQFVPLFKMNRDIFIRSLLLHACIATMTIGGSYLGADIIAANAVLMQFLVLISLGLDGIAYAVEALIGEAKGANKPEQIRRWLRACLLWSGVFAVVYCLTFWLFGTHIIALITNIDSLRETAARYLPWLVVLPLLAHWSYFYDGVFIGLTMSRAMRNTMAIAALLVFFPFALSAFWLGNHGLWLALSAFLLARGVAQWYWLNKKSPVD
ncbi:MAG: MATE family efflux transporter [Firmicutes bacterium]|nr:MATE family efflux transporter [Gammaproteobacteria bacterium]MCL5050111.1 MATE family efflux transporter [Bacillota bacterium]